MRLLYVITRGEERGGAQIHVRDLATELLSRGHDVGVIVGSVGRLTSDLDERGIPYFHVPHLTNSMNPLGDLRAVNELRRIIEEFRPDLVSLHSTKAGFVGRIACRIARVPCLFTAHGWAFTEGVPALQRALHLGLEFVVSRWCDAVICVSDKDRRLAETARIPHKKLITIHNGMPDIPTSLRARPGSNGSPFRIAMTGRLDAQKDHEMLIRAVARVPDVRVTLIGDGPRTDELKEIAQEVGVSDIIDFLGYRSDVEDILAQQDIFVLSSHYEGFPRSVLEAMRAGLPVIVTNSGGTAEAVVEGETGYVVENGQIDRLQERLLYLVKGIDKAGIMGENGRHRYETLYSFDIMFESTLREYSHVTNASS